MNLNENTDESAIVIWVTALEGATFETYRNDPSVGTEIRLPLAPAALADALEHEAEREEAEAESLRLCAWKYIGRFAPFEWLPLDEVYNIEEANLLAAVVMHNPEIDCDVLFQYCDLREVYDPSEVFNVALQYESIPVPQVVIPARPKRDRDGWPQPTREVRSAARLGARRGSWRARPRRHVRR